VSASGTTVSLFGSIRTPCGRRRALRSALGELAIDRRGFKACDRGDIPGRQSVPGPKSAGRRPSDTTGGCAAHDLFIFEVVKAHVATSPKHPEMLHYTGDGVFVVSGKVMSRRSRFRPEML
jgi:hypothetical protein